jgi:NADPH-dependent glutamate synthase beta subunit-like oxidoreductase
MKPEAVSEALLAAAPHLSRFVAKLFRVEAESAALVQAAKDRHCVFEFKGLFAKKRLFKASAGKAWTRGAEVLPAVARGVLGALGADVALLGTGSSDEELAVAKSVLLLAEVDDVARKVAKAGGATWTDALRERAALVRAGLVAAGLSDTAEGGGLDDGALLALAMDGVEAWLAARRGDHQDRAHDWPSLHAPHTMEFEQLVQVRRPEQKMPELFVGPENERRQRDGFALTDRRMGALEVESEVDYCLYCHDRDKDSCSKGLHDAKSNALKKNPLGVELAGCPLGEKISEMHLARQGGDSIAALGLVCVDNPMLPGTGHRICNDCMKACVFQKQEPVNIPQIETAVLTDVLGMPWGFEIYGLLTRWNPLDVERPQAKPYNGKNVLVVGLGPAGYTLAHHLTREGFAVVGVDGLKIEPLPVELTGSETASPRPIRDFEKLYLELDERVLLGFGGVSEYGITVRWDKNFLTVLYITLARNRLLQIHGGVRFGGTVELEDAWKLGFDHVAIAAGAGRPTIIPLKNNIARGIRKASDFLMALQLTGAYKRSSLANLQVRLPAIVIGGGLTAIDTATELLAYYIVQVEKTAERLGVLQNERGKDVVLAMFDGEEREFLDEQLSHAAEVRTERATAAKEGRAPDFVPLLDRWGGVSLVYRKRVLDSPAYRLNHEEVEASLQEGVRYIENMAPTEAVLDERGAVKAMRFERQGLVDGAFKGTGEILELPARTVCVAAGTSPNVTYEKEHPGSFLFDKRKQFFQAHVAKVGDDGKLSVEPPPICGTASSRATATASTSCRSTATTTPGSPAAW